MLTLKVNKPTKKKLLDPPPTKRGGSAKSSYLFENIEYTSIFVVKYSAVFVRLFLFCMYPVVLNILIATSSIKLLEIFHLAISASKITVNNRLSRHRNFIINVGIVFKA